MPQWWQTQQDSKKGGWGSYWKDNAGKKWSQGPVRQWSCEDPNCVSALQQRGLKPWANNCSRSTCEICGVHWNCKAQRKAEDLTAIKKELRTQLAAPAAPQDNTVMEVVIVQDEGTWMGSDEEAEPTKVKVTLPAEYQAIARLLQGPRELTEQATPAEKLSRFYAGKKSADVESLQEQLKNQKAFLELIEKKIATGDDAATRKKVEALTKQIEKATETEEGADVAVSELELAAKKFNRGETDRVARTDAATQTATEHADRFEEICQEQVEAWQAHLVQLRVDRTQRESTWEARRLLLEGKALEVVQHAEERIKEAKARTSSPNTSEPGAAQQEQLKQLEQLKKDAEEATKEKVALLERL